MASSNPQGEAAGAPGVEAAEETIDVSPIIEEKVTTPTGEAEVVVHEDEGEQEEEVETEVKKEDAEKEIASPLVENEEDEADPTFDEDDAEV